MNGYKNFDTYKMTLYIANERSNYFLVKEKKEEIRNMSDTQFLEFLRGLQTSGDKLDYSVIALSEIRMYIECVVNE